MPGVPKSVMIYVYDKIVLLICIYYVNVMLIVIYLGEFYIIWVYSIPRHSTRAA